MILKPYQESAVASLLQKSTTLLASGSGRKIIFKAPTGAGKTIMLAEFFRLLSANQSHDQFCVIWTAPRKLHTQSLEKLEKYYGESQALTCSRFFDLSDNAISPNEILFLNWESINRTDVNTIVVENEDEFYLDKVLANTREQGLKVVLVIDESHHHATSEISKNLIGIMSPDLTIEVSATPVMMNADELVSVRIEDVKEQGMIKLGVVLNPEFQNDLSTEKVISTLSSGSDAFVLRQAMAKLGKLRESYRSIGSSVNPLLLIQLPDRRSDFTESLQVELTELLNAEFGITVDNGKLAIYLSERQEHLTNIAKNDSPVEVMFFKQAISLGWDCPRAQILALFRDHKSLNFSIQTVGRIMRMPEPEVGHYQVDDLNHAYVFSNLADISINEDVASGYLVIHTSKLVDTFVPLALRSVHTKRQRERTRLNKDFTKTLIRLANEQQIASKIRLDSLTVTGEFIASYEASHVDLLKDAEIHSTLKVDLENELDLQKLFDFFILRNLHPFFPEERSVGRLKTAIYKILLSECGIDYEQEQSRAFKIVLASENQTVWSNLIDEAKHAYIALVAELDQELESQDGWTIPASINYPSNFTKLDVAKSVQMPFYYDNRWKSELAFIKFLESGKTVKWWFKNGDRDATYFAVPYSDEDKTKPFYVDFIVGFENGQIGLFDTKSGQTIETAKTKSDGLQKYVATNGGVIGGIVSNSSTDYSGRWVVFKGESSEIKSNDFSNWETLEI